MLSFRVVYLNFAQVSIEVKGELDTLSFVAIPTNRTVALHSVVGLLFNECGANGPQLPRGLFLAGRVPRGFYSDRPFFLWLRFP